MFFNITESPSLYVANFSLSSSHFCYFSISFSIFYFTHVVCLAVFLSLFTLAFSHFPPAFLSFVIFFFLLFLACSRSSSLFLVTCFLCISVYFSGSLSLSLYLWVFFCISIYYSLSPFTLLRSSSLFLSLSLFLFSSLFLSLLNLACFYVQPRQVFKLL